MRLLKSTKKILRSLIIIAWEWATTAWWKRRAIINKFHQEIVHWVLGRISLILFRDLSRNFRTSLSRNTVETVWWIFKKIMGWKTSFRRCSCLESILTPKLSTKVGKKKKNKKFRSFSKLAANAGNLNASKCIVSAFICKYSVTKTAIVLIVAIWNPIQTTTKQSSMLLHVILKLSTNNSQKSRKGSIWGWD